MASQASSKVAKVPRASINIHPNIALTIIQQLQQAVENGPRSGGQLLRRRVLEHPAASARDGRQMEECSVATCGQEWAQAGGAVREGTMPRQAAKVHHSSVSCMQIKMHTHTANSMPPWRRRGVVWGLYRHTVTVCGAEGRR